jgi:hypothetical protein
VRADLLGRTEKLKDIALSIADVNTTLWIVQKRCRLPQVFCKRCFNTVLRNGMSE